MSIQKSILIICQEFNKSTNACSVCLKNVSDYFVQIGYKVLVISLVEREKFYQYPDDYEVHEVRRNLFSRVRLSYFRRPTLFRKLKMLFLYIIRLPFVLLMYPKESLFIQNKLVKLASNIIEKETPSYVIASYTPFDCIATNVFLKQKYYSNPIKFINYHLDPLIIPDNKLACINKIKYKRGLNFIYKEVELMDRVLYPPSMRGLITSDNVEYVEFPLYIPNLNELNSGKVYFSNDKINLVYVGTLDQVNRNIEYLVLALEKVNKRVPIRLHIWGLIQDSYSKSIVENSYIVEYHGTVDSFEVPYILAQSDFNVNISNKISYNAVPSKIFQLFAAARPIINVVSNPRDYSLKYFEKYKNYYQIKEYERRDDEADLIIDYIQSYLKSNIIIEKDLFLDCTPEYVVDKLIS